MQIYTHTYAQSSSCTLTNRCIYTHQVHAQTHSHRYTYTRKHIRTCECVHNQSNICIMAHTKSIDFSSMFKRHVCSINSIYRINSSAYIYNSVGNYNVGASKGASMRLSIEASRSAYMTLSIKASYGASMRLSIEASRSASVA